MSVAHETRGARAHNEREAIRFARSVIKLLRNLTDVSANAKGGREIQIGALCQESAEVVMAGNISSKITKIGDDNLCDIFFSGYLFHAATLECAYLPDCPFVSRRMY